MSDFSDLNAWECRIALARKGVHTDFRLDAMGIRDTSGFERHAGLWGKTWFWQGWISEVCLHGHVRIDLREEEQAIAKITRMYQRVLEGFDRAERDYPDSIPCMLPDPLEDGRISLAENTWETKRAQTSRRDFHPTENIPEYTERTSDNNALLMAQIRGAQEGLHVEDSLNTYSQPGRTLHDCKDREWQCVAHYAVREFEGKKIAFKPKKFICSVLDDALVAEVFEQAGRGMLRSFEAFAPEGSHAGITGNGLPPGFLTLEEYRIADEVRRRQQDPTFSEEFNP